MANLYKNSNMSGNGSRTSMRLAMIIFGIYSIRQFKVGIMSRFTQKNSFQSISFKMAVI